MTGSTPDWSVLTRSQKAERAAQNTYCCCCSFAVVVVVIVVVAVVVVVVVEAWLLELTRSSS